MLLPIDNLAVCVMGIFGAEGGPADQTFEHDGTDRPPVTSEGVASTRKNLRGNVVRSAYGRVRKDTTGFAPGIDLSAVADSKVDLVEGNRLAVLALLLFRTSF